MNNLPQVGQKYQHKKWGEVELTQLRKLGRGYQVEYRPQMSDGIYFRYNCRLAEFKKATA